MLITAMRTWDDDWKVVADYHEYGPGDVVIAVQFQPAFKWRIFKEEEPVDLPCDVEPRVLELA